MDTTTSKALLDTQISLGDIITHLSTLAVVGVWMLKNHRTLVRIKDRSDMLWHDYCNEHEIDYKSISEE